MATKICHTWLTLNSLPHPPQPVPRLGHPVPWEKASLHLGHPGHTWLTLYDLPHPPHPVPRLDHPVPREQTSPHLTHPGRLLICDFTKYSPRQGHPVRR